MERVTLGSGSPRRLELLKKLDIDVDVKPPLIDEVIDFNLSPEENAKKLALEKLSDVKARNPQDSFILTADTFIAFKDQILGKPINRDNAFKMLETLSGSTHRVITGVSIYCKALNKTITEVDVTYVKFKELSPNFINYYLDFNEWIDAAGAYKIQNKGEILIESINGSYSSVMGLPISRIYGMFEALNLFIRK